MPIKPRRRWYRPRNIALALVAVFVAWLGREVYIAFTATPGPRVDYFAKLTELVDSHQPAAGADGDAWPILIEAARLEFECRRMVGPGDAAGWSVPLDYSAIGAPRRRWSDGSLTVDGKHSWDEVEAKAVKGIELLRTQGLPDLLSRAAAMPRAVRVLPSPPPAHVVDIMLPELSRFRQLARVNRARMTLAGRAGDDGEFTAAFDQTLALAKFTASQGLLIDYLVGLAIHMVALGELNAQVCERSLDERTLLALAASIERHPLPPMSLALEGERICMLDTIQWTHTDDGRGGGRLILSQVFGSGALTFGGGPTGVVGGMARSPLVNIGGIAFADRRSTTARTHEYFDNIARAAGLPRSRRGPDTFSPDVYQQQLSRRFLLLKMVLPSTGHALTVADDLALRVAGTRVMLAIELFRARTGAHPETLDALSLPAEAMVDPFSGSTFAYRRLAEPDRYGRRYLLYAVGADGVDDGGLTKGWQPQSALRAGGGGYDYVVNMPRATASESVDEEGEGEP